MKSGPGMAPLSPREVIVLEKAANGLVDKEIARQIDVMPATIRTYWDRLRVKLRATNRTHAVSIAVAAGWVTVDVPDLRVTSGPGHERGNGISLNGRSGHADE